VDDWNLPWNARCLCGEVRIRITEPPLIAIACHCRGCQKLTSGPYALTLMVPRRGFHLLDGAPVLGGLHRPQAQQHYCPHCKGWLYTTAEQLGDAVNFRPALLDDSSWVVPFLEVMTREKLPGVSSGAKRSYAGWAPPEDYPALLAAYPREAARPGRPHSG
jgi:hypothetical protein